MSLAYERLASLLLGTPLQRPAEWLRGLKGRSFHSKHPELGELALEGPRVEAALARTLRPGTNCIDVGCHLGSFLLRLVRGAPGGRHFAVEPVAYKARWLRRKFPQVTVLEMVAGEEDGRADFFLNDRLSSYSSLRPHPSSAEDAMRRIEVESRRLDDVIPRQTPIGFIKIDVNGAELHVLRGARRILAEDRPAVLLECTRQGLDEFGIAPAQVYAFVTEEAGYDIFLLKDFLEGRGPISLERFAKSMVYPFEAFNYWLVSRSS